MEHSCACEQKNKETELAAEDLLRSIRTNGFGPGDLIEVLFEVQKANGYISEDMLKVVSKHLSVPFSRAYGVVTFYSYFRLAPIGEKVIRVCQGTACYVRGAEQTSGALARELKISEGETTSDSLFTLENVACLGCCGLAPVMMINEETYGSITPEKARKAVRAIKKAKDNEASKLELESEGNGGIASNRAVD